MVPKCSLRFSFFSFSFAIFACAVIPAIAPTATDATPIVASTGFPAIAAPRVLTALAVVRSVCETFAVVMVAAAAAIPEPMTSG